MIEFFIASQICINAFLGWWVWRLERRLVVVELKKEGE